MLLFIAPKGAALAMEEVIVRAQHRDQVLLEVPISITVLNGEELRQQGLNRIDDFAGLTPGLSGWEQGVSTPIYAIRGISSNSFGIGGEASVAVIVDDAYVGRINSTSMTMVDVARVEVLKGPQGTLFGRNATAGAIVIYNNSPTEEIGVNYSLNAGDYGDRGASVTINLPLLADSLLFRATGFTYKNDGDLDNRWLGKEVGDEDNRGGRMALRLPGENFDATLSYAYQRNDTGGLGYETLDVDLAAAGNVSADPFDDELATDTNTYDNVRSEDALLRMQWQLGEQLSLLSITAYHDNSSPNLFDVDGSAVFLTSAGFISRDSKTWSQELRFAGNGNAMSWVAGAIVFEEDVSTTIQLRYSDINVLSGIAVSPADFGIPLPDFELCDAVSDLVFGRCKASVEELSDLQGDYLSYGIYGDFTWDLNQRLALTTGLRYSADDKDFKYRSKPVDSVTTQLNALNSAPLNPAGNLLGYSTEGWQKIGEGWDDWEARLALNYVVVDGHNVYGSISKGYKAGGFEPAATPALSVYDPEQVLSVEMGLRGKFSAHRLRYNLGAYAYDVDDYQIQVIENGLARTVNSNGIEGHGLEADLQGALSDHWQVRIAYTYTNAEFKDYATDKGNLGGNRTILTPEHNTHLALEYLGSSYRWGSLSFLWRTEYQSEIYFTAQNNGGDKQASFFQSFAQLTYREPDEHWQLDLFLRNVFDEEYLIFKQDVGAGPVARRGKPRYLGVAFSGSF